MFQGCVGTTEQVKTCVAPRLEPGTYAIGALMDAVCRLLDLKMTVTVYEDPVFSMFPETVFFPEAGFLQGSMVLTIQVQSVHLAPSS